MCLFLAEEVFRMSSRKCLINPDIICYFPGNYVIAYRDSIMQGCEDNLFHLECRGTVTVEG